MSLLNEQENEDQPSSKVLFLSFNTCDIELLKTNVSVQRL